MRLKCIVKVILSICLSGLIAMPVFAQPMSMFNTLNVENTQPSQTYVSDTTAKARISPRSWLVAEGTVEIADVGSQGVYAYADVDCYEAVDQLRVFMALELWDNDVNDYVQIDSWEYALYASALEEGEELTTASFIHYFDRPEVAGDYRIRGVFGIYQGSVMQIYGAATHGIPITP